MQYRIESDLLGELQVPAEAYYGVPEDMKTKVRDFLDSRLLRITDAFADWLKERETG